MIATAVNDQKPRKIKYC